MKKPNRYNPIFKYVTHAFCVIIGLTFIFSGFVKAVDPWGTAIKFNEYFMVYGVDFMLPLTRILAIWLCGAELMMGCMILCRVRLRLISIFALVSMIIFTTVTALSISVFPVEDCGCFGDAFYLTPWQTLIKNLILLPMVFTIWWRYRPDRILVYKPREVTLATIFCVVTMSFSAYNYFHLPLIDFLPYKVGVDLLSEVSSTTSAEESSVVMIYRNLSSGELREFSIEDTEWQDDQVWEWVETRTDAPKRTLRNSAADFYLTSFEGDNVTVELLSRGGTLNLVAITSQEKMSERCARRVEEFIASAKAAGEQTIVVTPQSLASDHLTIGEQSVEGYHIDATTFKSMMRASVGVVRLHDGVIFSKRSCIDL